MFTTNTVFPGITQITDAMGVSFTLIAGKDSALLVDAGYGTENVRSFVSSLTDKPVELILTHGHHDHILGARYFDRYLLAREDLDEFRLRTGLNQRELVRAQALEKGLSVPDDYLSSVFPDPVPFTWLDCLDDFVFTPYDLGDLEVWVVKVPGHTPGSLVVYVPSFRLLLTGDDWNPCTWIWFPSSVPALQWRDNMLRLLNGLRQLSGAVPETVLCSHQGAPREASELFDYLSFASEENLRAAPPVDMHHALYSAIDTHQLTDVTRGWVLVFDYGKLPPLP